MINGERKPLSQDTNHVPTFLSYYALLTKIPCIEIQGFKYGGQTPKKSLEYIA